MTARFQSIEGRNEWITGENFWRLPEIWNV